MRLRILLSLSLLSFTLPRAFAEDAADFFHGGAVNYLSNNIPRALEIVTNGRALYPDDLKLKKLEELLKQQNQQQQQSQQQDPQPQQEPQNAQDEQEQEQKEQPSEPREQQQQESDEQQREAQATAAGQMTPQQARQLLDSLKGDEQLLWFKPEEKSINPQRPLKDW